MDSEGRGGGSGSVKKEKKHSDAGRRDAEEPLSLQTIWRKVRYLGRGKGKQKKRNAGEATGDKRRTGIKGKKI